MICSSFVVVGFKGLATLLRNFNLQIVMFPWPPFKHQNALACSMRCHSERGFNMMLKGIWATSSQRLWRAPWRPKYKWFSWMLTCEKGNVILLHHSPLAFSDKHAHSTEMEGTRVNASWNSPSHIQRCLNHLKNILKIHDALPIWGHVIDRKQCILHINSFDQSPSMFINKAAQMYKCIKGKYLHVPPLLQTYKCTKGSYM